MDSQNATAPGNLVAVASSLLASGKYSDLTITCHGRTFKVHRAVVCPQSKPIAAMVDGQFKESATGVIDFPENHLGAVEKMIEFMYHGDYSDGYVSAIDEDNMWRARHVDYDEDLSSQQSGVALLLDIQVYALAGLYDMAILQKLAKRKYETIFSMEWHTSSFVEAMGLIYELIPENDRSIRELSVRVAAQNARELVKSAEFATLCKANGEIAFDVLNASLAPFGSQYRLGYSYD